MRELNDTEYETEHVLHAHTLKNGGEKKLLGLLGFAARARKLVCGTDLCRDAIRRGTVLLVLVASDASDNTVKRMSDACKYYEVDMCRVPIPSSDLARQVGKSASVVVIGVTDKHFTDGIFSLFEE